MVPNVAAAHDHTDERVGIVRALKRWAGRAWGVGPLIVQGSLGKKGWPEAKDGRMDKNGKRIGKLPQPVREAGL